MQKKLEEEIKQLQMLKELRELEEQKHIEEQRIMELKLMNELKMKELQAASDARIKAKMEIAYNKEMQALKQKEMSENLFHGKTHDGKEIKKKPVPVTEPQWRTANTELPKVTVVRRNLKSQERETESPQH